MSELVELLLAEDDETDVLLLRRAFRDAGHTPTLAVARDGQEAMDMLWQRGHGSEEDRLPALVILDLKMPRRNGIDVLQWMRQQPAIRTLPVFIFSSSSHRDDVERAYTLGANAFIVKPPSTTQRTEVARFINEWLKLNQRPLVTTEGFKAAHTHHAVRGY